MSAKEQNEEFVETLKVILKHLQEDAKEMENNLSVKDSYGNLVMASQNPTLHFKAVSNSYQVLTMIFNRWHGFQVGSKLVDDE